MNGDGSNQINLTNNPADDIGGYWSPDGTKILFTSKRDGNNEIYVMNADGSNQTRLTDNLDYFWTKPFNWSPDGTMIAFQSDTNTNTGIFDYGQIYVITIDGSILRNLTNNSTHNDILGPWSPDGTKIAFSSARDDEFNIFQEIYVMNSDGTNQTRLTDNLESNTSPLWSPDGTKILYYGSNGLYVMNADGSNQTQLVGSPGGDVF